MEHRYADVNGIRLHYVTQGSGPLVLFLHGFPEFWYEWRRQLPELGRDHQAVAVDMRGYNLSSRPEALEAYRLPVLVEDVRQLAASLTDQPFVLVAHDWGGGVAWAYAATHPETLRGLVVVNMAHLAVFARELRTNPAQQQASAYMTLFRTPQAEQALSANDYSGFLPAILGPDASEEEKQAYLEAWRRPGGLTGGLNYYRAARVGPPAEGSDEVMDPEIEALAQRPITVPTLVIWGMKDTALLPGNLDGLEKYVPNVRIRRVDDATHWVVREQPDLVNREIGNFLAAL